MTNIEIKAQCEDLERAERNLHALGAGPAGTFHQKDTYFRVARDHLKLRELGPDEAHLIFYRRARVPGPRRSDYDVAFTSDPQTLRQMLRQVIGIRVEVEKTRQVWLWENVRIHLDEVEHLGNFVEVEAVIDEKSLDEKGLQENRERVETLMRALEITGDQLVEESYGDLLAAAVSKVEA